MGSVKNIKASRIGNIDKDSPYPHESKQALEEQGYDWIIDWYHADDPIAFMDARFPCVATREKKKKTNKKTAKMA